MAEFAKEATPAKGIKDERDNAGKATKVVTLATEVPAAPRDSKKHTEPLEDHSTLPAHAAEQEKAEESDFDLPSPQHEKRHTDAKLGTQKDGLPGPKAGTEKRGPDTKPVVVKRGSNPASEPEKQIFSRLVATTQPYHPTTLELQEKIESLRRDDTNAKPTRDKKPVRPKLIYNNTYQLNPIKAFDREKVQQVVDRTLIESLHDMKYSSATMAPICGVIAEAIRDRVLALGYDRYKIVVLVNIGPNARQGVDIGAGCLWDPMRDKFVQGKYQSYHLFALACLYGIYFE